ncbi:hypothetical protein OGATHE_005424 [Ogataea polymorpha]|uniref:Uncharacterized protein n=1 Tax=Ogataea polymorpha TaxID=460523 RepID=A0A9P8NXL6_9ASCO|nr:hypothetical protein OGATHE_005424 [Ogataea polymorpha]
MDFRTWPTRALVAHFPKVVLGISWKNVVIRNTNILPILLGFQIWFQTIGCVTFKICHIKSVLVKAVHVGEEFPGVLDGLLLKVVAKRPVTQHFKKSVVVGVSSDVLKIVVFSTGSDTFLRIHGPLQGGKGRRRIHGT